MRIKKMNNRGSAMLVAIVVSIIVIAFCLSLLLVCYSLFKSSSNKQLQLQTKEIAYTLSDEITSELTKTNFNKAAEFVTARDSGQNILWFYVRYNLFQDNWPYYSEDETLGHRKNNGYRYFNLELADNGVKTDGIAEDVSVCMYWKDSGTNEKEGSYLCVDITVTKGSEKVTVKNVYELSITKMQDVNAVSASDIACNNLNINPSSNIIDISENWKWTKYEQN